MSLLQQPGGQNPNLESGGRNVGSRGISTKTDYVNPNTAKGLPGYSMAMS